jgi:hypothetical protein
LLLIARFIVFLFFFVFFLAFAFLAIKPLNTEELNMNAIASAAIDSFTEEVAKNSAIFILASP